MYCVDLPWGCWEIHAQDGALVTVLPATRPQMGTPEPLELEAAGQLMEYAQGSRKEFSLPLKPHGTAFQQTVWQELSRVPYGCSISYGELARRIGRPTACRAVAQAVGANPCLVLLPCHRILGSDGSVTGFSAGLPLKRQLLTLEGILWKE